MNSDAVMLCTTSKQGISFWEISNFDWQLHEFPTQEVEQDWFIASSNGKQCLFNKAIQYSASGQEKPSKLACVTQEHELFVFDVAKRCIIWPTRKVQAYEITSLCFFSHDELLCIGTRNGQLRIFQLYGEKLLKTLSLSSNPISLMTASKDAFLAVQLDAHRIAIVSLVDDRIVGKTIEELFEFGITYLTFSPFYPSLLAVAGDEGSLTVVDISSTRASKKVHFPSAHISPVSLIAFSPTNPCLLCSVGLDKSLCFFDMEKKKKKIRMFSLHDYCESLQFLNSGSHLVASFQQGQLSVFDLRGGIQERSSLITGQVIQSITILDKESLSWTGLSEEKDNARIPSVRKSKYDGQEKENIHSISNRMKSNNMDVFPASDKNEGDSFKLLLHDFDRKSSFECSRKSHSDSVQTGDISNRRSSETWMNDLASLSSQKQEQFSEEVDKEILTKENLSQPFSTSWEETPILPVSLSGKQGISNSENVQLADDTNTPNQLSESYPNPFQCFLQEPQSPHDPSNEPLAYEYTNKQSVNNTYSSLLQSIEDIQYANNREIKQHIQNLHIDVIRSFEEQQNRMEQLEQLVQHLVNRIQFLEQRDRQNRILLP